MFDEAAVENAYRRGFYQGVSACSDAMDEGFDELEISEWLHRLLEWRHQEHGGKKVFPEWLAQDAEPFQESLDG